MADPLPTETILERAYFHVGNGGMTLSIVEERSPEGTKSYRFKHELSVFGAKTESSFPLGSSDIVSWMNMALQRVSLKVATAFADRSFQPFDNPMDVTHMNGQAVQKLASLLRVVARFQRQAFEFPSEKALEEYLHEHPQADKSKHTVKEHEEKGAPEKKPDSKPEGGKGDEKKPKSWGERLKNLSEKAKKFVEAAPKALKEFIEDPKKREQTIANVVENLRSAPGKIVDRVVDAAKEEVHEFKEAGHGLSKVMSGKKPSEEESKAIKKVALHMTIAITAAALSSGGAPFVAAGAFGKSLIRKVAMKAVKKSLEHVHMMSELGEIGHGLSEVMDKMAAENKAKEVDPTTAFAHLIASSVAEELESHTDEDVADALDEASKQSKD